MTSLHSASRPPARSHNLTDLSLPVDSKYRPSWLGHTARGQSTWPRMVLTQYPVVTSQIFSELSLLALTSRFPLAGAPAAPLGMNRTELTMWSCPGKVRMFLYSSEGSHSLMVRSEEQDARSVPPRGPPKSTSRTALVCPLMVRSSSPSSQSQILMV